MPLLAKSNREGRLAVTLLQHSLDAESAGSLVFRPGSRWLKNWLRFFKLNPGRELEFLTNLRVACLFHDLGKANAAFAAAVRGRVGSQLLRHEHLSALILHLPQIRSWLEGSSALDVEAITAAVLSHHLKAASDGDWRWCQPAGLARELPLFLQHPEVDAILERVSAVGGLGMHPSLPEDSWKAGPPWEGAFQGGMRAARRLSRETRHDIPRRSLLLALKAGVIVADSVASGLVREGHGLAEWIEEVCHAEPISGADVRSSVLTPRAREIESKTGHRFLPRPFQTAIAGKGRRVLLLSGCGSGKTLAAWNWAESVCSAENLGRVVFLYPTRGTATEGFRDYVGWAPEADAALVHGTSRYELESMAGNPSEATRGKQYEDEAAERLFALGLWSRRYFSATVDQFLGFLQHGYRGLCLLPILADSAVVIDEIHSFDSRMFDSLVSFLRDFDVPVLCMTATLQPDRQRQLEGLGLGCYPGRDEPEIRQSLSEAEAHPRYEIERVADEASAMSRFQALADRQLRVLWVVNTVARCQGLARRISAHRKAELFVYHSRFRLADRALRHASVVEGFRPGASACVAVTTQVCEMSLDLDADVLLMEEAPIPSLVQRLGRANRHGARGPDFRARIVTYPPAGRAPYEAADLAAADGFLGAVSGRPVSQLELASHLARHVPAEFDSPGAPRFLDGGYFATPGSLRDEDGVTARCILDSDLEAVNGALNGRRPLDGWILTLPAKMARPAEATRPHRLPADIVILDASNYDSRLGYSTERE